MTSTVEVPKCTNLLLKMTGSIFEEKYINNKIRNISMRGK